MPQFHRNPRRRPGAYKPFGLDRTERPSPKRQAKSKGPAIIQPKPASTRRKAKLLLKAVTRQLSKILRVPCRVIVATPDPTTLVAMYFDSQLEAMRAVNPKKRRFAQPDRGPVMRLARKLMRHRADKEKFDGGEA